MNKIKLQIKAIYRYYKKGAYVAKKTCMHNLKSWCTIQFKQAIFLKKITLHYNHKFQ